VVEKIVTLSQREEILSTGKWEQVHIGAAAPLITHTGNIINKTSGDWKDVLKGIKKGAGPTSTIDL
jgi:hypothetical protein